MSAEVLSAKWHNSAQILTFVSYDVYGHYFNEILTMKVE